MPGVSGGGARLGTHNRNTTNARSNNSTGIVRPQASRTNLRSRQSSSPKNPSQPPQQEQESPVSVARATAAPLSTPALILPQRPEDMSSRGRSTSSAAAAAAALAAAGNTNLHPGVEQLIARQMNVSRALSEQEETSFHLIQTLVQLSETVQAQEQQLKELQQEREEKEKEEKAREVEQEKQEKQQQPGDAPPQNHPTPFVLQLTQTVQSQKQELATLQQDKADVDSLVEKMKRDARHQSLEQQQLEQQVESLSRSLEKKESMLRDRDAVIKIMAQKVTSLSSTTATAPPARVVVAAAPSAGTQPPAAEAPPPSSLPRVVVTGADLSGSKTPSPMKSLASEASRPSTSPSNTLRQRKAAREERLLEIMDRLRQKTGGSNGETSKAERNSSIDTPTTVGSSPASLRGNAAAFQEEY